MELKDKLNRLEEIITGYGQMIVELPASEEDRRTVIRFFEAGGLTISEV